MRTMVVGPHPDDELLGCGGTLLRRRSEGGSLGWVLFTRISEELGFSRERVFERAREIQEVREALGIQPNNLYSLDFHAAGLDRVPLQSLIEALRDAICEFEPEEVLVPFGGDIHSDHRRVFEAVVACVKWFRLPSIQRVLVYETLSETDILAGRGGIAFQPNYYVNIQEELPSKLKVLESYPSELGVFPFPRSREAVEALAKKRGVESGYEAAEAFQLLFQRS